MAEIYEGIMSVLRLGLYLLSTLALIKYLQTNS